MAWRSSGDSNEELVENLAMNGMLPGASDTDAETGSAHSHVNGWQVVKEAFLAVDRGDYARTRPYDDAPQSIGYGVTISAPHMHALALKHLWQYVVPRPGRRHPRVLDVGSGSGYLTHVLGILASSKIPDGGDDQRGPVVVGIEHIRELCELATANMRKSASGSALLDSGRVVLTVGDGRLGVTGTLASQLGMGQRVGGMDGDDTGNDTDNDAKFDAIHVGAAAKELHAPLLAQLRAPGRIFIPMEDESSPAGQRQQHLWTIDKDASGRVTKKKLFGVRYVPLTDAPVGRG